MKGKAICKNCGRVWIVRFKKEDNLSSITCSECGGKHLIIEWITS